MVQRIVGIAIVVTVNLCSIELAFSTVKGQAEKIGGDKFLHLAGLW